MTTPTSTPARRYDVVLIGSGISSLTCALILAKKGKSVCVLEQYSKPGGYMHCFNRFGHRFDTGAHYVGAVEEGQAFHTLLKYLDVYDSELFVPLDPEGFDEFHFPSATISFPKGYAALIERLNEHFPSEKEAIRKYFAMVQEAVKNFQTYEFSESVDMMALLHCMETPLSRVVEELTTNPLLRSVFYTYCVLHGTEPEDTPFGMHAVVTDSFVRGPHGLKKGGDYLAQRFVHSLRRLGGELYCHKKVSRIEMQNGLATAVITDKDERFEADCIISGIHPKRTLELLSDKKLFSPLFQQRIQKLKESMGIFGIYASLERIPELNPLKNYYYFASDDPRTMLKAGSPREEPNSIFLAPSARMATESPTMAVSLHAAGPIEWFRDWETSRFARRPAEYEARKEEYAEKIFDFVSRYNPALRPSLANMTMSTPLTNLHFNGSPDGSSYGIYHSIQFTGARGIGPRTHVANLHLTGQSTLFPGLLGAAISGLRTAGHVIGIKPLILELKTLGSTRGV